MTIDDLIRTRGGPTRLARELTALAGVRVTPQRVCVWQAAGHVDGAWLRHIQALCAREGAPLDADQLLALTPRRVRGQAPLKATLNAQEAA